MSTILPPETPLMQPTPDGGVVGVGIPAQTVVSVQDAPKLPADPSVPPDHFVWRYFVSMLMELKDGAWGLSIGRVLLLTLFVHAMVTWSMHVDIPDHEMGTMGGLLGYVLGSKIASVAKDWGKP